LIGGTAAAMDSIDGGSLVNGDRAFCIVSGIYSVYYLNATSGAVDNGTTVIAPDTNAGTKRWIKCN
jgi:hypothetical protein